MIPVGLGGYGTGAVSASSDHLVIRITGKGGHGAHHHTAVDPINIGVHIHLWAVPSSMAVCISWPQVWAQLRWEAKDRPLFSSMGRASISARNPMSYLQRAQELYEQMVSDRRYLHQHPEVGMELPETTEYVIKRLSEMGCQRSAPDSPA